MTKQEWWISGGLYLKQAGIRSFKAHEVCDVGRTHSTGTILEAPPPEFWPRIIPTLKIVQELRDFAGVPVWLNSGYRSPDYNRVIGGASRSQHKEFRALDVTVTGWPPPKVAAWFEAHPESQFMGIGRYRTFTHVDTRGSVARWSV